MVSVSPVKGWAASYKMNVQSYKAFTRLQLSITKFLMVTTPLFYLPLPFNKKIPSFG